MRAIVQRVSRASVTVDGAVVGAIDEGLCVLVGVGRDDGPALADKLADRLWKLRIFSDDAGKMNLSVADIGGSLLIISQFTLYADTRKGNRPSYVDAADPAVAEPLIARVVERLRALGAPVATGTFRAEMAVELVNDGPVTVSLEIS